MIMNEEFSMCKTPFIESSWNCALFLSKVRYLEIQLKRSHHNQHTVPLIFETVAKALQVISVVLVVKFWTFQGVKLLCDSGFKCIASFLYYSLFSFHIML